MANDDRITVQDLRDARVPGARLAVLSACESALIGHDLPDEVVNLPTALLEARVAGVVGTLWAVPEQASTLVLMARFYELWRGDAGLKPPQALRLAQQWVRDTTNGEKRSHFPELAALSPGNVPDEDMDFWEAARAHSHPSHWAGFIYVGV